MKKTSAATAIVSTKPVILTIAARLSKAADLFTAAITHISAALSRELNAEETGEVVTQVKTFSKLLEKIEGMAKGKAIELLKSAGQSVGDKGTLQLITKTGTILEARGSGGGYDAKKVEALIRAKELSVEKYMDQVITYSINDGKMEDGIKRGKFTTDELDTCRRERTYALQTPKKAGE